MESISNVLPFILSFFTFFNVNSYQWVYDKTPFLSDFLENSGLYADINEHTAGQANILPTSGSLLQKSVSLPVKISDDLLLKIKKGNFVVHPLIVIQINSHVFLQDNCNKNITSRKF
jgi:hypothetical protein